MKVCNADDRVHVLEGGASPYQTLANICESGVQEESFFVCDVDEIIRKFKEWTLHMPRVHPHYAVKCNDTQTVIEVLAALGTGFDCATKAEMTKVLDLGVEPSRIIYAHPCKIASHIRHAANNGVRHITFDNETELYKMHSLYPTAKLVIRIRCDDETALVNLGIKYGCDAVLDAPHLLAVAASLGLDVVGVSFHVGSGCRNPSVFRKAIGLARDVFDVAASLGFHFNLLDIGGGFSGSIAPVADVVNQALDELFPDPDVHVIAEPGRYFCDSAFTLAVSIHSRREIKSADGDIIHVSYYINDGVYGSFNGLLCDFRVVKGVPLRAPRTKLYSSTIWGQTCDGLDKIESEARLPMLELGSWLVYKSMGAYSVVTSTAFNGFPIPKVHMVCSKAAWHLLKERTPLSNEHFVLGNLPANIHMGLDIGGKVPMGEVARRLSVVSLQGHDHGHGDLRRTTSTGSLCSDGASSADLEGFSPELFRSHDTADHELGDHDHDLGHVHELADLADNSPLMYDPFKLVL